MEENREIVAFFKRYKVLKKIKEHSSIAQQAYFKKRLDALTLLFDRLYGRKLKEELFKVYDDLCPDDEMQDILDYICTQEKGSGVVVSAYELPGVKAEVNVRLFPVRIELVGKVSDFRSTLWTAA